MAAKKVWLTWLPAGDGAPEPQATVQAMGGVGLEVSGAPLADDLPKAQWSQLATELEEGGKTDLLVIAGRAEDWAKESLRYAVSLVLARLNGKHGAALRFVAVGLDGMPDFGDTPTFFHLFDPVDGSKPGWAAKLVAFAFQPNQVPKADYRFDIIAHQAIGQWFEIGPVAETWDGVMAGVAEGAEILHHAVGEKTQLPEKTVLEYASQGIKAAIGDDEFTIWSVQNKVSPGQSYFLKVDGFPKRIIFGGHPGREDAEVNVVTLS